MISLLQYIVANKAKIRKRERERERERETVITLVHALKYGVFFQISTYLIVFLMANYNENSEIP